MYFFLIYENKKGQTSKGKCIEIHNILIKYEDIPHNSEKKKSLT